MTPERQKWWNSLPEEEKLIRCIIKHFEEDVKLAKAVLKRHHEACAAKVCMQTRKRAIKALRKQIGMCPQVVLFSDVLVRQPRLKCPCCSRRFILHTPYCARCGQKLRWK